MAEALEQRELLLAVTANVVAGGKVGDQLADAGAQLEGKMRRRGPDEGIDVANGRLGHRLEA